MEAPFRSLLSSVIDYAGLFPPARLSMDQAVAEYLAYVHGPERWIVNRFVCGAGRLSDLLAEIDQHTPEEVSLRDAIPVAVVGTAATDNRHWHSTLEHDAHEMARFQHAAERRAELDAFEVRVPDTHHLDEYLRGLSGMLNVDVFVELPWQDDLAEAIALVSETDLAGVKARTGGLERNAFPSPTRLAEFIQGCVQADCAFKCTAGLHEPVSHPDPLADHFGFLNVLFATALCIQEDLTRKELAEILADQRPEDFRLEAAGGSWRGTGIHAESLAEARALFVGFGSCSIAEPLAGLERLTVAA